MIQEQGLADRIKTMEGDFIRDRLGTRYDLILMSNILHIYSPAENQKLIQKAFSALTSGGQIVVVDIPIHPSGTRPLSGAMFSINMLVNTDTGRAHTAEDIIAWLHEAGFLSMKKTVPDPRMVIITANKRLEAGGRRKRNHA